MAQISQSKSVERLRINVFRTLLLAAAVLVPLWGYLTPLAYASVNELVAPRIVLGLISLSVVGLSFVLPMVRSCMDWLFVAVGILIFLLYHTLFRTNEMNGSYAMGVGAVILAVGFSPITARQLVLFLGVVSATEVWAVLTFDFYSIYMGMAVSTFYVVAIIAAIYQKKLFALFERERSRADRVAKVAAQAAHDIKGPIGALNVLQSSHVSSEKAKPLLEKVVQQGEISESSGLRIKS